MRRFEEKSKVIDELITAGDGEDVGVLKNQFNWCEHGSEIGNSGMMERCNQDERDLNQPVLAKQNNDAISEPYVCCVTTRTGKFFLSK